MFIRIVKFIGLLLFANLAFAITADDNAAELWTILESTTNLKADFSQVVYGSKKKVVRTVSGHMAIKRPKLLRWEVEKPETSLIVVDGKKFWNYDEELQQVTVQEMDDSYESSPVSLFLAADIADISKKYTIHKRSVNCFQLTPKNESDSFKKVELTFKSGLINSLVLVDQLNQTSKISFTNVQANINLAADLFIFEPPAGVDVVED